MTDCTERHMAARWQGAAGEEGIKRNWWSGSVRGRYDYKRYPEGMRKVGRA